MILTITTIREISEAEWEDYKRIYDSHPDTNKIDWRKLETEGSLLDVKSLPTEKVETLYMLNQKGKDE
jgi:hypothetical protein